jgi:hypothetical protein
MFSVTFRVWHENLKERGSLEKTESRCKANIERSVKKVMDGHGMD